MAHRDADGGAVHSIKIEHKRDSKLNEISTPNSFVIIMSQDQRGSELELRGALADGIVSSVWQRKVWVDEMKLLPCRLGIPILVLAAFGSVAFWNGTALACRCAQSNPTAQQVLDGAKVVFSGVAKATTPVGPQNALTKFMVVESFKGSTAGKELIVRHRSGPTPSCGVSFDTEKTHLIVARAIDESPGLATSYCSVWMFQGSDAVRTKLMKEMRAIGQR